MPDDLAFPLSAEEFADWMQWCDDTYKSDPETKHMEMDRLMMFQLEAFGYAKGISIFRNAERWYS